jgi:hypothetical protein
MPEPIGDDRDLLRGALGRTPECPPLESLAAPQTDANVRHHLEECPHCRAELALMHQFEGAEAQPEEAADVAWIESELRRRSPAALPVRQPFGSRLRDWFGFLFSPAESGKLGLAAAALLVLVTAGIVLRPGTGLRIRPSEESTVLRSGRFAAISPLGDLDRAPSRLRWEAVAGAANYHVRLLEVDGTEVWSADSVDTTVDFPSSVAARIMPGRAFQWDATAHDAAGKPLASTDLQSFHILATRR